LAQKWQIFPFFSRKPVKTGLDGKNSFPFPKNFKSDRHFQEKIFEIWCFVVKFKWPFLDNYWFQQGHQGLKSKLLTYVILPSNLYARRMTIQLKNDFEI
jgi:hypothetical protein